MGAVGRVLAGLVSVAVGVVLVAGLMLAWPTSLGGRATWTVVSGESMEPRLHTGDLVLAYDTGAWTVGDTVVYRTAARDGSVAGNTIHRITAGTATTGWTLRGDNKAEPDPGVIADTRIVGEELWTVPGAGTVLLGARQPGVLLFALALLASAGFTVAAYVLAGSDDDSDDADDTVPVLS